MTFKALAESFVQNKTLPISVNSVLAWIRENTDYQHITLHGVKRDHNAFRGAFRRKEINVGPLGLYGSNPDNIELHVDILYGSDLDEQWKRLVIVKEALHVFDGGQACVNTPDKLRQLIPQIISPELKGAPFVPAINDHFGAFRAMAVLMPSVARKLLAASIEDGTRTVDEVANYVRLPEYYVDIWMRFGDEIEPLLGVV